MQSAWVLNTSSIKIALTLKNPATAGFFLLRSKLDVEYSYDE